MCACAIFGLVYPCVGTAICRSVRQGDPRWPGRLQKSSKCRLAWKSTCTPARLASKRTRQLRIFHGGGLPVVTELGLRNAGGPPPKFFGRPDFFGVQILERSIWNPGFRNPGNQCLPTIARRYSADDLPQPELPAEPRSSRFQRPFEQGRLSLWAPEYP